MAARNPSMLPLRNNGAEATSRSTLVSDNGPRTCDLSPSSCVQHYRDSIQQGRRWRAAFKKAAGDWKAQASVVRAAEGKETLQKLSEAAAAMRRYPNTGLQNLRLRGIEDRDLRVSIA